MRLLEVVAGLLFVLMQVVNYVLVLRARTQRSMNEKMKNRVATVLLVVILATIGVILHIGGYRFRLRTKHIHLFNLGRGRSYRATI